MAEASRKSRDEPPAPADGKETPSRGTASGTRVSLSEAASIDSILLDYLNKPTSPAMPAVVITNAQLRRSAHPVSKAPTRPPVPFSKPPEALEAPGPEDDATTGQWDYPLEAPDPRQLVRDRGVLVRIDGQTSGEIRSLPRGPLTIGRSSRADIHLADPSVSREHSRIVFEFGTYFVEDLASHNGTFVAGRKVTRVELRDGDLVQFGQRATFRFAVMDGAQEEVMQRLYDSSMKDPLTGVDNRRHFDARLTSEIAFSERHRRSLSIVLLDIDFFKSVNDRYGHPAGDAVLRNVATTVRGQLRTEDAVARYGGEEFVFLLRDTGLSEAVLVAERVRERIAKTLVNLEGESVGVTISAGCSSLSCCAPASTPEMIAVADRRLYKAKRGGRNRVVWRDE